MDPKEKRNQKIYADRTKGMTWRALIVKYDLSLTRLQFIIKRQSLRA
jgi:Mor family transcriptional regulator